MGLKNKKMKVAFMFYPCLRLPGFPYDGQGECRYEYSGARTTRGDGLSLVLPMGYRDRKAFRGILSALWLGVEAGWFSTLYLQCRPACQAGFP